MDVRIVCVHPEDGVEWMDGWMEGMVGGVDSMEGGVSCLSLCPSVCHSVGISVFPYVILSSEVKPE